MPASFTTQEQQILDSFTGSIPPVRVSSGYGLALLLVALLMVLLPLVYVGIVATVAWGWWWYLVHGQQVLGAAHGPKSFLLMLVIYVGPLVVGAILVIFMFKPLFARAPKGAAPCSADERRQPFLFAFVRRLCAAVGAPEPRRIDLTCEVNASASFRRGLFSLIGKDLVLTIGLTLVAGQNLRQFTGVLAHEFGHFAQAWAMRANYLVRSINMWFARVVYQRDAMDEWLQEEAENEDSHWAITSVMYVAAFFVWVTRGVLFLLMMLGHAISSLLSRHMEFDADRHAFRLVGREPFSSALRELPVLGAAESMAQEGLAEAWKERKLADDFPHLVSTGATLIPDGVRERLIDDGLRHSGGMYASHPPTRDRIRAAESDPDARVFSGEDVPAQVLFSDFPGLCRNATLAFYRDEVGLEVQPQNLIATTDLVGASQQVAAVAKDAERVLGKLWSGTVFFAPQGVPTPVRDQDGLIKDAEAADEAILELKRRQTLVAAGVETSSRDPGVGLPAAHQRRVLVRTRIARAAAAMNARLAPAHGTEAEGLRACLTHLAGMQAVMDEVREGFVVLLALLQHLEFRGEEVAYGKQLKQELERQRERLVTLRETCGGQVSPFPHDQQVVSLADQVLATLPAENDLPAIMEASQQAMDHCFTLHQRVLGRLVALAGEGTTKLPPPGIAPAAADHALPRTARIPAGSGR